MTFLSLSTFAGTLPVNQMVVFGDSLSDDGNGYLVYTFDNAWRPLYLNAYPSMNAQVTQYLGSSPSSPASALYVLWGGANDLLDINPPLLAGNPLLLQTTIIGVDVYSLFENLVANPGGPNVTGIPQGNSSVNPDTYLLLLFGVGGLAGIRTIRWRITPKA